MMRDLLQFGFDGIVCSAGGYVMVGDQVIYDCPMTREQQERAIEVLSRNGVRQTIECKDGCYCEDGFVDFLKKYASGDGNSEVERWKEIQKAMHMQDLSDYDGSPVYKIVLMCHERAGLERAREELKEDFNLIIQDPFGPGLENGEIINRKFNKGKAIERICDYLGMSVADTVGFGDSMNDKEMLEVTGLSICMENGCKAMKELADEIAPPVWDDGLYKAFQKFGLL